ncbi:MAG: class I SAM-dependent methyltransferase [Planctomycetaceae bacterium]|jgi:tRNA (cmo5U34)-methyltransferase|nr:class I SAM-dependent methyltransferase [Planctomycetaceae bacterium]
MVNKISIDELRCQFDSEVERFSNEQTGQTSAVDSQLVLSLFETLIARMYPHARRLLDVGCGAGNFSLRISRKLPQLKLTLLDLSQQMLQKAKERLAAEHFNIDEIIQADVAHAELPYEKFDLVVAAMSLHHLRTRQDWKNVFGQVYSSLIPGGSFWVSDLIRHENETIEILQKERYAEYLCGLQNQSYQQQVFEYIDRSDTPETLQFLTRTLTDAGFHQIDIIHKNIVFAAFVAVKPL